MNYNSSMPEIWGGIECTINRIGDNFRNQLKYAGHYERQNDLETIAGLGIKKMRYPILWEAHQFKSPDENIDWSITGRKLKKLQSLKIEPIAGLLHHGSGPIFTSLEDESFAEKFALYAAKVARKFPWLQYYTPVNEPLTTARFSGLYGHWYPHHRDELCFATIFLNQLKGIILSMKEIRKINSSAKLVQTEDLAKVHSTALLKYQADFENKRRWLTYDFLCGKVDRNHFFWEYFISLGVSEKKLQFFLDHNCAPNIAGFNYYVTSERYLDEKIHLHAECTHGYNGEHCYADIAAVSSPEFHGLKTILKEAWDRYHISMAMTEIHLNCTREEQMRWFKECWDNCVELRKEGVDIKAVTAWSLLGAYDWDSLLTKNNQSYETGVFEISNNQLRATAMAGLIKCLSGKNDYEHPLLLNKGWWHQKNQIRIEKEQSNLLLLILEEDQNREALISGILQRRSIDYCILHKEDLYSFSLKEIREILKTYNPWAIITEGIFKKIFDISLMIPIMVLTGNKLLDIEKEITGSLIIDTTVSGDTENKDIPIDSDDFYSLIDKALDLLIDKETGIWAFNSRGFMTKRISLPVII